MIENQSVDNQGKVVCVLHISLFIRGIGGFGGQKSPPPIVHTPPNRSPDSVYEFDTYPNQAILYRLCGDLNPLHVDPNFSALGGFERPILHGLCTFGIATHGVVRNMCENDASRISSLEGRFTSPVIPGNKLRVDMWKEGAKVLFVVTNVTAGKVAIANGAAIVSNSRSAL